MKWFSGCNSIDEAKKRFRDLCKKHHPDLGGNVADMQSVNAEYEQVLRDGLKSVDNFAERMKIEKELAAMVERLIVLKRLLVEICGRWIWITGDTYSQRKNLKAFGCFFAEKKKAWYWRSADEKAPRLKQLSLEEIRTKYGSIELQPKDQALLA